jgi:hypothetical protein
MTYKGIAIGKTIELEEPLPYLEGQLVIVSVEPFEEQPGPGSAAALRQAMHEPPHLNWEDVDELERAIGRERPLDCCQRSGIRCGAHKPRQRLPGYRWAYYRGLDCMSLKK